MCYLYKLVRGRYEYVCTTTYSEMVFKYTYVGKGFYIDKEGNKYVTNPLPMHTPK